MTEEHAEPHDASATTGNTTGATRDGSTVEDGSDHAQAVDAGGVGAVGERHDISLGASMVAPGRFNVPGVGPVVESEFASISVNLDTEGNSVRLRLEDLRTGQVRHLDALELETVIWLNEGHLTTLLDPSHDRWRG